MPICKKIERSLFPRFTYIFLLAFYQLISIQTIVPQCYNNNLSFKAGEKLSYGVYYSFGFIKIKLADVVLWVEQSRYNNKDVLVLKNTTLSLPEYSWIIKVDDYYASYIEINSMMVERHIQKTLVDKYSTNYEYRFDHAREKIYATIENSKTKKYLDTIDLKPCLHDLLSAAYYPRNIDFTQINIGEKITIPVILNTTTYDIYFKYLGAEKINSTNKKNLNCIKIVPLLVETSIFKAGEKMTVWLSNDRNKVPIRMESELWIGKIVVNLIKYEGLKYPTDY